MYIIINLSLGKNRGIKGKTEKETFSGIWNESVSETQINSFWVNNGF